MLSAHARILQLILISGRQVDTRTSHASIWKLKILSKHLENQEQNRIVALAKNNFEVQSKTQCNAALIELTIKRGQGISKAC